VCFLVYLSLPVLKRNDKMYGQHPDVYWRSNGWNKNNDVAYRGCRVIRVRKWPLVGSIYIVYIGYIDTDSTSGNLLRVLFARDQPVRKKEPKNSVWFASSCHAICYQIIPFLYSSKPPISKAGSFHTNVTGEL
jgi:hypothetical protein